jgi:DNA-binding CsgD family transcriptional regulator
MVRNLVHHARESSRPPGPGPGRPTADSILLDVEVDGVRCTLVSKPATQTIALSPREREVARMVAKGYPNKTIASVLEISCWTVGTHLRRIFSKLAVTSRAAMVAMVVADGLLTESDASRPTRISDGVER